MHFSFSHPPLELSLANLELGNPPAGRVERSEGRVKCEKRLYKSVHRPRAPPDPAARGRVT